MGKNRTQEAPKSTSKTKWKKDALEDRLGAVLGRSWVVLGERLGVIFGVFRFGFISVFENRHVREK